MALNAAALGVVVDLAAAFTSVISVPTGGESVVGPLERIPVELFPPTPTQQRVPLDGFTRTGQHR